MGVIELAKEAVKVREALEALALELEFFERLPVGTCENSQSDLGL